MNREKVVVTGMGVVTPLGGDLPSTWEALVAGRSGVGPIRRFDASGFDVTFAAEVDSLPGEDPASLKERLVCQALEEALRAAGPLPPDPERIGVCLGSESARPSLSVVARRYRTGSLPTLADLMRNAASAPTDLVADRAGAKGILSTISTACTSSSQAVGEGTLRIRRGEADVMIVGGVDVLVGPLMLTGFSLLGALSTRNHDPSGASRPFDRDRDGFVLGEGAGILILERESAARSRGAEILAVIGGYGCSSNAWRITDSPPDGRGAAQAMSLALEDANLAPEDVGYINAHGTSTPMNDPSETRGIQRVFGEADPWVSSTKSMMGHLVAACGAVEAIICAQAIRTGILPPTINLDHPDPHCAMRHVSPAAVEARVDHALTNAFGFGGSNGSLVISRAP
jgi:3-oxoacyl-[acyl-carrier-protein] synthase II